MLEKKHSTCGMTVKIKLKEALLGPKSEISNLKFVSSVGDRWPSSPGLRTRNYKLRTKYTNIGQPGAEY